MSLTCKRLRPVGTLVMYLYGDTDPLYRRNFEFFTEHGMDAGGGSIDFVVFVQVVRAAPCALFLFCALRGEASRSTTCIAPAIWLPKFSKRQTLGKAAPAVPAVRLFCSWGRQ